MQFLLTKPAFYYDNTNIRKKVRDNQNLTNIYSDTYIISRHNVCLSVIKSVSLLSDQPLFHPVRKALWQERTGNPNSPTNSC